MSFVAGALRGTRSARRGRPCATQITPITTGCRPMSSRGEVPTSDMHRGLSGIPGARSRLCRDHNSSRRRRFGEGGKPGGDRTTVWQNEPDDEELPHYTCNGVFRAGNDLVAEKNQYSVTHDDVDALKPLLNTASGPSLRALDKVDDDINPSGAVPAAERTAHGRGPYMVPTAREHVQHVQEIRARAGDLQLSHPG
jgi:hypothetical protein